MKSLSANIDESLLKAKTKTRVVKKPAFDSGLKRNSQFIIMLEEIRDKELENAQKQIQMYQREIASLKSKVDGKSGYDK